MRKKAERRKPVLIIQHAPHEHPAVIRRALESQGIQTLLIHPYRGEAYPSHTEVAGVISLGGPMNANADTENPWIPKECELLSASVHASLPVVGVCLGGQLMARALGGRVERHVSTTVGWFPISVNPSGLRDPLAGAAGEAPTVYHWHEDTFYLPPDAELLASSTTCERQIYRIGANAYGFQFHPEADHQLVHEWLAVEGIETEIEETRKAHGTATVQNSEMQRQLAAQGERASLKITAAIGSLFRRRATSEVRAEVWSGLGEWATQRTLLTVEFEDPRRKTQRLRGRISTILSIPAGQFLIFQDEVGLLWPIRLDDILKIKPSGLRKASK